MMIIKRKLVHLVVMGILLHCTLLAAQVDETVTSGMSDADAIQKVKTVLTQGGSITFEEGNWDINIPWNHKVMKEVAIYGANLTDDSDPYGAYESIGLVKSTITLSGYGLYLTESCPKLTIKNISILDQGISADAFHQPVVDFDNVVFDITADTEEYKGLWRAIILKCRDGLSGSINHVSFKGFGAIAIQFDRTITREQRPSSSMDTLIINRCDFIPFADFIPTAHLRGLSYDAGNDEYAPTWQLADHKIQNSRFENCGIAVSKGSHLDIKGNHFEMNQEAGDMIHIEEFSYDFEISDNTATLSGDYNGKFLDVGAEQNSSDIIVAGNTIDQNGQLSVFAQGACARDITINGGNTVLNPQRAKDYINFWWCNNTNINVADDGINQPGLTSDYQSISTSRCDQIMTNGDYYMIWDNDKYLVLDDGVVKFVEHNVAPDDDKYRWRFNHIQTSYLDNSYTIMNLDGQGFILEVIKGPTAPEQKDKDAQPCVFEGKTVYAEAKSTYENFDKLPTFSFHLSNRKYALMLSGNERRSNIVNDEGLAALYIVYGGTNNSTTRADYADYSWNFVATESSTSLTEKNTLSNIEIYPNPTKGRLTIDLNGEDVGGDIQIIDMCGKVIYHLQSINQHSLELELDNYQKGIYFLKYNAGNKSSTHRIIVE